jgi:hypothetical protein
MRQVFVMGQVLVSGTKTGSVDGRLPTPQLWTRLTLFQARFDRVLAAVVGGGFFLQGLAELLLRLDEPAPLLFWRRCLVKRTKRA